MLAPCSPDEYSASSIQFCNCDTIGNLTAKHEWGPSDADVTRTLTYANSSHVHAPSAVTTNGTTESYSYDANGNLTSRAGQTLQYDTENRLTRVRNSANQASILCVLYNGDGQRILTVDSTGTKVTLDKLYEKNLTTSDVTLFIYAGSRLIATKKNGTVSTIHPDHLGGIALTMQGSTVVSDLAFYPFGEQRSSSTGTPTSDRRFNGESLISSVGLYQMGARWYDPAIGRWTQPDSILPDPRNPQLLNRYSFVANNPTNYRDPSGHCFIVGCVIAGALLLGGGASAAVVGFTIDAALVATAVVVGHELGNVAQSVVYSDQNGVQNVSGGIPVRAPSASDYWTDDQLSPLELPASMDIPYDRTPDSSLLVDPLSQADVPHQYHANKWGSRGSPAHKDKIDQRIKDLKDSGYEHLGGGTVTEEYIETTGGYKSARRPDITMRAPDGSIYRENVGLQTKTGDPIRREREALDDIERVTGVRPAFTPYN